MAGICWIREHLHNVGPDCLWQLTGKASPCKCNIVPKDHVGRNYLYLAVARKSTLLALGSGWCSLPFLGNVAQHAARAERQAGRMLQGKVPNLSLRPPTITFDWRGKRAMALHLYTTDISRAGIIPMFDKP